MTNIENQKTKVLKPAMLKLLSIALIGGAFVSSQAGAASQTIYGMKYPDSRLEAGSPVVTPAESPIFTARDLKNPNAYTELIPYLLPAPNQQDAGSCLYMALTGMAEWWKARLDNNIAPKSQSDYDLSERYLMNVNDNPSLISSGSPLVDTILSFNSLGSKAVLNRDYPFTMGWIKDTNNGYVRSDSSDKDAYYSTSVNWINELSTVQAQPVKVPFFSRVLIFKDKVQDRWAVNVAPKDIVDQVKTMLLKNKAPVTVIYNHYLYWHAVNIVGYNDDEPTNNCKFTSGFPAAARQKAQEVATTDPARAKRWNEYADSVEKATQLEGGCQPTGVFYVRDSLYKDDQGEIYDYDKNNQGEEENYTKKVIQREYQWLKRFSNHAYQILAK